MISWLKEKIKFYFLKKRFIKSKIYFGVQIDKYSTLGRNSVVFKDTVLIHSTLGAFSYIQKNSEILYADIDKFCSIAGNVYIGLANHPTNYIGTSPVFYDASQPLPFFFTQESVDEGFSSRTSIASDVWIGQGVMVKAGVNIGVGAVIGAGAVVTKDVTPYSIVGGVPAKHIKYRFKKELREKLLLSQWWEYEEETLKKLAKYFNEPEKFLEELQRKNS